MIERWLPLVIFVLAMGIVVAILLSAAGCANLEALQGKSRPTSKTLWCELNYEEKDCR